MKLRGDKGLCDLMGCLAVFAPLFIVYAVAALGDSIISGVEWLFRRRLPLLAITLLAGCAETSIYENGQLVFRTQADLTDVTFTTARGTTFHAAIVNHSGPTLAGAESAGQVIGSTAALAGAVGTAIVTSGIAHSHPTTAVIAAAVPPTVAVAKPSRVTVAQPTPRPR